MAIDPGRVAIRLWPDHRVEVACERPKLAPLLVGRTTAEVLALVPLLFAVCGRAQGLAARLAVAAAHGRIDAGLDPDQACAREAAREHAWRLMLDWPAELGRTPDREGFLRLLASIQRGSPAEFSCPDWLEDVDDTRDQTTRLPCLDALESISVWPSIDEAFARHPDWRGIAAETGPGPAIHGEHSSARTRLSWRVRELADFLAGRASRLGVASAATVSTHRGRALVQTARGLLMHEVRLDGDHIAEYVIVAPTDWNFCAGGPLACATSHESAHVPGVVPRQIRHLVLALDPCVPWEVHVE